MNLAQLRLKFPNVTFKGISGQIFQDYPDVQITMKIDGEEMSLITIVNNGGTVDFDGVMYLPESAEVHI